MDWLGISLLYGLALILLLGDIFLPSHGILTVASLGLWAFALYVTFQKSEPAGFAALAGAVVIVPSVLVLAVKNWHRTPMGRRISPANPVLTDADRLSVEDCEDLIGAVGRTVTLLRPVGTALLNGKRVECSAEQGVIPANTPVEGVRLADRTLVVRPVSSRDA